MMVFLWLIVVEDGEYIDVNSGWWLLANHHAWWLMVINTDIDQRCVLMIFHNGSFWLIDEWLRPQTISPSRNEASSHHWLAPGHCLVGMYCTQRENTRDWNFCLRNHFIWAVISVIHTHIVSWYWYLIILSKTVIHATITHWSVHVHTPTCGQIHSLRHHEPHYPD